MAEMPSPAPRIAAKPITETATEKPAVEVTGPGEDWQLHYVGQGFECDIAIPATPENIARGCEIYAGSTWRRIT